MRSSKANGGHVFHGHRLCTAHHETMCIRLRARPVGPALPWAAIEPWLCPSQNDGNYFRFGAAESARANAELGREETLETSRVE
jgi:hypothetical protein